MLKKLGLIALSLLFVSPAFASAQDFTFTSDGSSYNVSSFTTDGGVINMTDYSCISNECSVSIGSGNSVFCRIDYQYEFTLFTCDGKTLLPGTYRVVSQTSDYFDSITFSIVGEDSGGSDSNGSISIPSGFGDSINGLVSNFAGSIGNYAPTILIVGFGILVLFTFWGYIRHASSELFTLNRKGNKSLGWFQKEDIVNMYTNWKNDRVSKHDVNKIIENDYDYDDVSKRAEFYADNELRNTDGFYSMSSEDRMEIWGKYKMDYINKHYKKNI